MPKILILGEAWGADEELQRIPFSGAAGYELNRMLFEAKIDKIDCHLATVFNIRPKPTNDIENLCASKREVTNGLPPLKPGKYLRDEFIPEVKRCLAEIADVNPNLIVAMGNTAAWLTLGDPRIGKIRGTTALGQTGHKVLPTYNPAAILRQWDLRHVTVLDLMKAKREAEFPDVRRPQRFIHVPESIDDIGRFYRDHIEGLSAHDTLAADIETAAEQITCYGFAPSALNALVIPLVDPRRGGSYWPTLEDESRAIGWIRTILGHRVRKIFQNGLYDINWTWKKLGIPIVNAGEDTMLLHHALLPESEKGLGFLGSVYTNEPAWKLMRAKGKGTIKKEN
jgi:uracil-DNA glycosylase family 4